MGRGYLCKPCAKKYQKKWGEKQKLLFGKIERPKTYICCRCKIEKPIDDFYPRKVRKVGVSCECKKCCSERRKYLWRNDHTYKRKLQQRAKRHNATHKKERSEYNKRYGEQHKLERNKRLNVRRKIDINFRLRCLLSGRIRSAVRMQGTNKSKRTMELLGCSIDEFRQHLERQFDKRMTWENYGRYGWHIDHTKPCAVFNLVDPQQQKECFHYSNLQPLWHVDNFKKTSYYKGKLIRNNIK